MVASAPRAPGEVKLSVLLGTCVLSLSLSFSVSVSISLFLSLCVLSSLDSSPQGPMTDPKREGEDLDASSE